jgi:hypothetical protein
MIGWVNEMWKLETKRITKNEKSQSDAILMAFKKDLRFRSNIYKHL